MDKHKLVQIIVKDLEEIKVLSEEVAESQGSDQQDGGRRAGACPCQGQRALRRRGSGHGRRRERGHTALVLDPPLPAIGFFRGISFFDRTKKRLLQR